MPNFTQIGQTVWISIRYEHIYIYIFCALYIRLAGSTRRCPGHYIKIIKCIVRAKVARKVSPKVLHLLFNKLCLKMTDHGSRSTWGPGPSRSGPKICSAPTKTDLPYNFCFIKFSPRGTVEAVDALQTLFRAP